jgi:hypothetical protein
MTIFLKHFTFKFFANLVKITGKIKQYHDAVDIGEKTEENILK